MLLNREAVYKGEADWPNGLCECKQCSDSCHGNSYANSDRYVISVSFTNTLPSPPTKSSPDCEIIISRGFYLTFNNKQQFKYI